MYVCWFVTRRVSATATVALQPQQLHCNSICTTTAAAPQQQLHRNSSCTTTAAAPQHQLHRNSSCTATSAAPQQQLHRNISCTATAAAPQHQLHRNSSCTATAAAPQQQQPSYDRNKTSCSDNYPYNKTSRTSVLGRNEQLSICARSQTRAIVPQQNKLQ